MVTLVLMKWRKPTAKTAIVLACVGVGIVAVVIGVASLAGTSKSSSGVPPYQDAFTVQGTKLESDCSDCLSIDTGSKTLTLHITESTRYDSDRPFEVGKPLKAYAQDQQNADGSYNAIELLHQ